MTEWILRQLGIRDVGKFLSFRKYFEGKRLEPPASSWRMHLLFTLRVLLFCWQWRRVRNVAGREDRSLASGGERRDSRSFHVRAQPSAVQNTAGVSSKHRHGKEKFAKYNDVGYSRVPKRIEDASAQPSQAALQIAQAGSGTCSKKGLRSTPRRSPPKNAVLTHHRSRREVAAPSSGP